MINICVKNLSFCRSHVYVHIPKAASFWTGHCKWLKVGHDISKQQMLLLYPGGHLAADDFLNGICYYQVRDSFELQAVLHSLRTVRTLHKQVGFHQTLLLFVHAQVFR